MDLKVFASTAATCAVAGALLLMSAPADARINYSTCQRVYAACNAGDQAACNSKTYEVCVRQGIPDDSQVLPLFKP